MAEELAELGPVRGIGVAAAVGASAAMGQADFEFPLVAVEDFQVVVAFLPFVEVHAGIELVQEVAPSDRGNLYALGDFNHGKRLLGPDQRSPAVAPDGDVRESLEEAAFGEADACDDVPEVLHLACPVVLQQG